MKMVKMGYVVKSMSMSLFEYISIQRIYYGQNTISYILSKSDKCKAK